MIGLPFAVVATSGPALQRWYSWSRHKQAHDPYFLFAASNLGSFGGLLAYPLLIEPHVSLPQQRTIWSWGFVIFAMLTFSCALTASRNPAKPRMAGPSLAAEPLGWGRILVWIGLAFLPSSLMLGVTAHISTDVAAIPLLWVVPLAIYLATFVAAFGQSSRRAPKLLTRVAVVVGVLGLVSASTGALLPIGWMVAVDLLLLVLVAYTAHRRLAADRPPPEHLTTFYLVIALGGATGGLLNGLLAPVLFDRVIEFQLVLLAIPILMLRTAGGRNWLTMHYRANRVRGALITLVLVVLTWFTVGAVAVLDDSLLLALAVLAVGVVGAWHGSRLPVVTTMIYLSLFGLVVGLGHDGVLDRSRSFYGSYAVRGSDGLHTLSHGTTVHGSQFRDGDRSGIPTTYYARSGPLGRALGSLGESRMPRVAAIGLGVGTIAAYGHPGQRITFFEIDPDVVDMARDPRLFSYLAESEAEIETVVGDGRLRVAEFGEESFDVLILDAFSSDSIPVHLLTEEAMEIYANRLVDDGVLMVHVSNRVFDLEPVMAAAAGHLGWEAVIGRGTGRGEGATPSVWVVLTSDEEVAGELLSLPEWTSVNRDEVVRWTDDYSSILAVLR